MDLLYTTREGSSDGWTTARSLDKYQRGEMGFGVQQSNTMGMPAVYENAIHPVVPPDIILERRITVIGDRS